jgi:muramoyltetrapeptide carboxypeptidase
VGGNVSLRASCTADLLSADGALVLLEDVDETPHRLDRALTQLRRSGWLEGARGFVLGGFSRCGDPDVVRELVLDRCARSGVPIMAGAPVGHDQPNLALVLGAPSSLRDGALVQHLQRATRA